MTWHPLQISRNIGERWVIEGDLVLQTPTHLGNGDSDSIVDMPLLRDEVTGGALLPGTSLAGALRNYLRERRHGFEAPLRDRNNRLIIDQAIESLFGATKGNDDGDQSALIIDDAVSKAPTVELRDGVRIDPVTRTAKIDAANGALRGYKYDLELLEAGATFPLRMELAISADNHAQQIKELLALALDGLAKGEITLGLRKRRGFGACRVSQWRVRKYDLRQPSGLIAWLAADRVQDVPSPSWQTGADIAQLLGVTSKDLPDKRSTCTIQATLRLDSSLLIRAGFGEQDRGPDTVHLHSKQANGQRRPVLSGTSLAGALRHRAERIVRTMRRDGQSHPIIDEIFGPAEITRGKQPAKSSRLVVKETVISNPVHLVQNRIRIDRFTGSVHGSGLFNEQPVFGNADTYVKVHLTLRNPQDAEIGLLLLVLKDLWTGDLPLGGEVSIGRGRLKGLKVSLQTPNHQQTPLEIEAISQENLKISGRDVLEQYVQALHAKVNAQ